ncbi:hypothetical protein [Kitasatospora paranensis]|uniref:Uncharacterized protein n=1 Tax=Kitasatospora paranensis TaxID=258053 RepID=A0ABW2FLD7_9ACTN
MSSTTRRLTITIASLLLSGAAVVPTSAAVAEATSAGLSGVAPVAATSPAANGIGWD